MSTEHSTEELSPLQVEHLEIRAQHLEEHHRGRLEKWSRDLMSYELGSSRFNPGSPPALPAEIGELRERAERARARESSSRRRATIERARGELRERERA